MMKRWFPAGLLMLLLGATTAETAQVSGKVTIEHGEKTVAGVQLMAWPISSPALTGEAPLAAAPTGADGRFSLELPPGEYFFLARGAGYFAYYGRNPVTVPEGGLPAMNLGLVAEAGPLPTGEALIDSGVLGVAGVEGQPLANAVVFAYTDLNDRLKGMGLGMSAPTGADGRFELPLPPGTYYLIARQRQGGGLAGPLRSGDFIGYYPGNPVVVKENEVVRLALPLLEVPDKVDQLGATLFGQTSVQGRILDAEGQPVAGMRAMLYDDPSMLNRPLFVSQPSGADGAFVLSFPRGGTYYLAARRELGGTPQPGELYGRYGGATDSSLRLATGEGKKGIDIVVEEMW